MRPPVKILTEADLRALMPLGAEAVACIRDAFLALATKPVAMPPILRLDIPEHRGEVDVKTAYVPGLSHFAIKISPGFFGNPALGLPSTNGMMVVLSSTTGLVEALLLDNGYLTDIRTAAAGAVAAHALARADATTAAILGAGMQARMQLQALTLVRPLTGATVWARDPGRARAFAQEMTAALSIPVTAAASVEDAVRDAGIVVTTTPSDTPILHRVAPGTHVTAMGSDAPHKNEIAADLIRGAHYVADRLSQTRTLGELHHAGPDGGFPELGQILAGLAPGRSSPDQITLADLTGTGIQDTAIAALALARAAQAGAGHDFTL
ncbi:cyclodeaminase [Paracoccus sp. S3-43]|uniref:cyclodeaminase n=1 Tax=Paracoccus sp. S3-43 TaxID=3030011 RepID=UPI0023AFC3A2|nr:cyclodeaminase [Paracoccus sp. S3-43]WEF25187.1 cyclodeaminase [Paracoccus sp. S3-43]